MGVAGTREVEDEARGLGYENILRTSGMVVNPIFYEGEPRSDMSRPTVVIFFGGFPPNRAQSIAEHVLSKFPDVRVIVLCGGNSSLEEVLQGQASVFGDRL